VSYGPHEEYAQAIERVFDVDGYLTPEQLGGIHRSL
jgi:hypothetical protein